MSWATDRVHQDYSSTGKYNSGSALAKEYAGLKEDGGSRVDDGEGWREGWGEGCPTSLERTVHLAHRSRGLG